MQSESSSSLQRHFEQNVQKQIKIFKQMKLDEMKLAWEIWKKGSEKLQELMEINVKGNNSPASEPNKKSFRINQNPEKKKQDNSPLEPSRKSSRVRKTPKKFEDATDNSLKNKCRKQAEDLAKDDPPEKVMAPEATSNDTFTHPPIESTEETRQDTEQTSPGKQDDTHEPNPIAQTLVQNFIAKICKEHSTADINDEELSAQDSDHGSNKDDRTDTTEKQIPAKNKKKSAAKGNLTSRKRGRKSNMTEIEMLAFGFKRDTTGRLLCLTCSKTFPTPTKAEIHTRIHRLVRPHECDTCLKRFHSPHALKRHRLLHAEKLPFPCPVDGCTRSYVEKRILDKHVATKHPSEAGDQIQESPQSYQCEECGKEMKYKANLAVHMKLCHEGARDHQCSACGKLFQTKSNLMRHQVSHSAERPHTCTKCPLTFKTRDCLQKHALLHEDRPYKCELCWKGFTTGYRLKEHMNTHMKRKVFLCEQCGQGFNHRNTLRSHYKLHFQDRKYQCSVCEWAFYSSSDLHRHRLIHTDDRPYQCESCGKSFARKDAFQKHLRIHGGASIYRCFYCGQSFWNKSKGKRHVMWCTGGERQISDLVINAQEDAPEIEDPDQQQLDIIQIATSESHTDNPEESTVESSMSSTVLNLTGMNLDILSINSGYIIVRKPWTGDDQEEDSGQMVIAADGEAVQEINEVLEREAYEGPVQQILQTENQQSVDEDVKVVLSTMDGVFQENDQIQMGTSDASDKVSPLEQAMRQAGLHGHEILQLQTQGDIHTVVVSTEDTIITQQTEESHNEETAQLSNTQTNIPADIALDSTPSTSSNVDLPEALQFNGNTNVSDHNNFVVNTMDCFPNEEQTCAQDQADRNLSNKDSDNDQWFQW